MPERPGRLRTARVGVVTILDAEVEALKSSFGTDLFGDDATYLVDAQAAPAIAIRQSSSRGHLATLGAARDLIEDFRPELIIMVGIAAGIEGRGKVMVGDDKIAVDLGDVVVPDYLHYSELVKFVGGDRQPRYVAYDQPSASIRDQFARASVHRKQWLELRTTEDKQRFTPKVVLDCSLIAGEKLLGDPTNEEQRKIVDFFSDAAAVDMESVAVARATYEARRTVGYNPRFLVIRGVSDLIRADPKISNDAERANWTAAACRSAACFAKDLVESFLATPDPRS